MKTIISQNLMYLLHVFESNSEFVTSNFQIARQGGNTLTTAATELNTTPRFRSVLRDRSASLKQRTWCPFTPQRKIPSYQVCCRHLLICLLFNAFASHLEPCRKMEQASDAHFEWCRCN